jgi:hypothetical protein
VEVIGPRESTRGGREGLAVVVLLWLSTLCDSVTMRKQTDFGVLLELALEAIKGEKLSEATAGVVLLAAVAKQSQTKEKTLIVRAKALPMLLRVSKLTLSRALTLTHTHAHAHTRTHSLSLSLSGDGTA